MEKIIAKNKLNSPDSNSKLPISNNNWNIESDVSANFSLAHDENNIILKFTVRESNIKARYTNFNEPVWNDSCVEFFISFNKENYYNFEFNCIGNALGGHGSGKTNRVAIEETLLKNIKIKPSLGFNKIEIINRPTDWTLEVIIPKETFCHDKIDSFVGMKANGNFYKCGDEQVKPHFLSWTPILSEQPNFHLPEFFGEIEFE